MPAFLLYSYVSMSYLPSPMELSCQITINVRKKKCIFHCWQYLTLIEYGNLIMSGACVWPQLQSYLSFNYIKIYHYDRDILALRESPASKQLSGQNTCIRAYTQLGIWYYFIIIDSTYFIFFSGLDLDKFIKFDPQVKCWFFFIFCYIF